MYMQILENKSASKRFIKKFTSILEQADEIYIGPMDAKHILYVFHQQGYWAGVHSRIYYVPETDTFFVAPRTFAGGSDERATTDER